jgi:gliding motility-associated-like protein
VPIPQLPDSIIVCKGQPAIIAPENYQVCNGLLPVKWFYSSNPTIIISDKDTLNLNFDANTVLGAIVGVDTLFTKIIVKTIDISNPLQESYAFCLGDSLKLNANIPGNQNVYLWNTGEIESQIYVNQPGIYKVQITKNDCQIEFQTLVELISPPFWNIEQDTFSICDKGPVSFTVNLDPAFKLVSSDGQVGNTFTYNMNGNFTFKLSPTCGNNYVDTVAIVDSSFDPDKMIMIPNVFTPNGDNRNDEFKITSAKSLKDFELSVFNRWGKKLFSTFNPSFGWDGKTESTAAPSDVYIYHLRCSVDECGKVRKIEKKGDVTLIR